ncbi:MAG TPA: lytic transglycosylase domain-containing protein [Desulfuromonadaceae bacterium]
MIRNFLIIRIAALVLLPAPAFPFCFEDAGRAYGISPQLLRGIARVESNMNPAAINRNGNGSTDLGLMQVNSFWLKALGATPDELLRDACYNVMAGAWILKGCIDRHGETWNAVGCYNASSHDKRVNYSWRVYRELRRDARAAARNSGRDSGAPSPAPPPHAGAETGSVPAGDGKPKSAPAVSSLEISVTEKN